MCSGRVSLPCLVVRLTCRLERQGDQKCCCPPHPYIFHGGISLRIVNVMSLVIPCCCFGCPWLNVAGRADDMNNLPVRYDWVYSWVESCCADNSFLSIEKLAETISQCCLQNCPQASSIEVTVRKPQVGGWVTSNSNIRLPYSKPHPWIVSDAGQHPWHTCGGRCHHPEDPGGLPRPTNRRRIQTIDKLTNSLLKAVATRLQHSSRLRAT